MIITWPGSPGEAKPAKPLIPERRGKRPPFGKFSPTPVHPAQPIAEAVGAQDSPVIKGQKPNQVPVNVPAQPKQKRRPAWWEADWEKVASQSRNRAQRLEVIQEDLGKGATASRTAVTEMEYSDVVKLDFSQTSIQGRIHATVLSDRPGEPWWHTYITDSWKDFPVPRLQGSTTTTRQPYVPRNPNDGTQVSPGFIGEPTITRTNVLPVVR